MTQNCNFQCREICLTCVLVLQVFRHHRELGICVLHALVAYILDSELSGYVKTWSILWQTLLLCGMSRMKLHQQFSLWWILAAGSGSTPNHPTRTHLTWWYITPKFHCWKMSSCHTPIYFQGCTYRKTRKGILFFTSKEPSTGIGLVISSLLGTWKCCFMTSWLIIIFNMYSVNRMHLLSYKIILERSVSRTFVSLLFLIPRLSLQCNNCFLLIFMLYILINQLHYNYYHPLMLF